VAVGAWAGIGVTHKAIPITPLGGDGPPLIGGELAPGT
jgi:hypothetical protein